MAATEKQVVAPWPEESLPQMRTLTIGILEDGQHAVTLITSKGTKVLARELLFLGDAEQAENAHREEAYFRVWQQQPDPSPQSRIATAQRVSPFSGKDVLAGHGFGLCRKEGQWVLYEIEHHGEKLTRLRVHQVTRDFLDAWERLDILVGRFLIRRQWKAERSS